jgi:hypothetical protein
MPEETVEPRNVTMYGLDWATVDALAKDLGLTTSSALRVIVREWRMFKGSQLGFTFPDLDPADNVPATP